MPKSKPMTAAEFARYAESIPKDKYDEFNAMLSFVEDVVTERAAGIAEKWAEAAPRHDLTARRIAEEIRKSLTA